MTTINVGTTPNDGTGDPLRTAMQTINANFAELASMNQSGAGSPEGVRTAPPGAIYTQTPITTVTGIWLKATGSGNTGWEEKITAA